ncbi:MAG TPA: DinB family protein [Pyrinomonadaceae bacterium]|jgi:uncharacterized damage-inducible protein DinB|nr:DinB family protein [Pyrinomonadaceae bacterium]
MNPRIQEVIEYLDLTRADLTNAVERIPADRRDQRPDDDRWSVAEILEHLNIIESRIGKLVTGKIEGARAAGLGPEVDTSPVLDTLDRARIGDRTNRVSAPEAVKPQSQTDAATAWAALQASREKLRAALLGGDGLALSEVKQEHPVLGVIDLYQWAIFVGAHEARHTAQVREIE